MEDQNNKVMRTINNLCEKVEELNSEMRKNEKRNGLHLSLALLALVSLSIVIGILLLTVQSNLQQLTELEADTEMKRKDDRKPPFPGGMY